MITGVTTRAGSRVRGSRVRGHLDKTELPILSANHVQSKSLVAVLPRGDIMAERTKLLNEYSVKRLDEPDLDYRRLRAFTLLNESIRQTMSRQTGCQYLTCVISYFHIFIPALESDVQ